MQKSESGFVVIVTMLVMAGLIGLGLSVANQSTEETLESGTGSDSVRVFNAAEAGVEQLLSTELVDDDAILELADFDGSTLRYRVTGEETLKTALLQGGTASIDLPTSYTGTVSLTWDGSAALLIALYTDTGSAQTVQYQGVNAFATSGVGGFATGGDAGSGKSSYALTAPANTRLIRIKSLLASTNLTVSGSPSFSDPQYYSVRSEATGGDGVTRTIEVNKTIEVPPAILDYAVYSGGSITKN
ncbi:MAG: pilus assembly PilX N-terminal domain-containing protein [bacterium]|nr:pilus assembly PilX N-terminal domain-containing protein [bacterium]